jgi:transcriptional regulator PpsR
MDVDGVITDVSLANTVSGEGVHDWIGRPWADTVEDVAGDKVRHMVAQARANGVSDFGQITQRFPSGLELPIEYNAVLLGADIGLVAVGKNLRAVAGVQSGLIAAQHAREQDAWKLRAVETRHRLLFECSDEPLVQIGGTDLQIIDANPAAVRAGALDAGRDFVATLAPYDRDAFHALVARVAEHGRAPRVTLHIGPTETPWLVRASLATPAPQAGFLLQLSHYASGITARPDAVSLENLIERLPDSFVLIDADGIVLRANRAFFDLVQAVAPGSVIGQPVGRWLQNPGADVGVLIASVQRHRIVRSFSTTLQGELGTSVEVEISAAGNRDVKPQQIGISLRDISRRQAVDGTAPTNGATPGERLLGPLVKLADQIGHMPLLQLVRDTGGLIERHYIEDALGRVNGNRTAAAELLGLSRQSLYAKLSRHGMGSNAEDKAAGD